MENLRNAKVPRGAPVGRLLQVLVVGGAGVYGIANSLFNVEGGHRAIVFNRLSGIKEQVSISLIIKKYLRHPRSF
jgi:prohibitin 2